MLDYLGKAIWSYNAEYRKQPKRHNAKLDVPITFQYAGVVEAECHQKSNKKHCAYFYVENEIFLCH
ncbi:MAG: hypothetical protein AAFX00_11790, partial [Pseudomonadota bacterium]